MPNYNTLWSIVSAGPVCSMQALILAILFTCQKIHVFDKRHTYISGHGLLIRNKTIVAALVVGGSTVSGAIASAAIGFFGSNIQKFHYQIN